MDDQKPRKRRLFVGIALDEEARRACAAVSGTVRKTGFSARFEAPEKLHVTLAFLGFVEPSRSDEIAATLASCARGTKPFAVALDKLGAFPHERRPRVVFVGSREQGTQFRELAARVREAYTALGFEFNDDAVAHVTIARVKESRKPLPLIEFAPIALEIKSLELFESLPDPANKTSRYKIAATFNLANPMFNLANPMSP